MEKILLVGHGSPKKEANNLEIVGELLHNMIHPNCKDNCIKVAYLQFGEPGILEAIENCIRDGARSIIIHPYFLSSGMHVTRDVPEIIKAAQEKYPEIEFICTEPLGIHEKLAHIIMERINVAKKLKPEEIEKRSFEIISEELDLSDIPSEQQPIIKRVIHATADLEFKRTMIFHPDAISTGLNAIRSGKNILVDVEMVKAGIIKRLLEPFGGSVICHINNQDVIRLSEQTGKTRAEIAIEKALMEDQNIGIIAIGNAPTALLKVIEIFNSAPNCYLATGHCYLATGHCYLATNEISNLKSQPLVIGMPVGFVKAFESKMLLSTQNFPFITNLSRKGGTPVAVAIVNALLKLAHSYFATKGCDGYGRGDLFKDKL